MKLTKIITAKIEPDIYLKILDGSKKYEIRDHSFEGADFIRYIDAAEDSQLTLGGIFRINAIIELDQFSTRAFVQDLSGISPADFDRLFPQTSSSLGRKFYIASIGERIALQDIFTPNNLSVGK